MSSQQPQSSNEVFPVFQLLVLFGAVAVMLSVLMAVTPKPTPIAPTATPVQVAAAEPTQMPSAVPPTEVVEVAVVVLDPQQVRAGEGIFQTSCAACHGFNARGISGLGLTMVGSEFVNGLTDDELHDFLLVGRPVTDPANSTGVAMPARGGNPSLTDENLYAVIAYIRSLNVPVDSAAVPTTAPTAAPTASGPTLTPTEFVPPSLSVASADVPGDEAEVPAAPDLFFSSGEIAYNRSCAGCHGLDGEGVPLTGPALTDSDLLTDREGIGLLEFLTREEPPIDPREGYPHPYRGGYPLLTDEQILNIIAYLYELTGRD